MKRFFRIALLALLPACVFAQPGKQVRIISSEGIYPYTIAAYDTDRFDLKDSLEANLSSFMSFNILNNALRDAWPDGLKGDKWETNRYKLDQYNAYVECYFKHYTIVNINYSMNQDMEPSLRPKTRDFFLIIDNNSLSYDLNAKMKKEKTTPLVKNKEPKQPDPVPVKVDDKKLTAAAVFQKVGKKPVEIRKDLDHFDAYDAAKNPVLKNWLAKTFSAVQAERITARMKRANWPKGTMKSENDDAYHQYKAYLVWEFRGLPYNGNDAGEELALLFIPKEENRDNVPADMRPETAEGMFMVYRRISVEYEGSTASLKSWEEMNGGPLVQPGPGPKPVVKPEPRLGPDLAKAIQAYPKKFATVKGKAISKDIFGNQHWEAKLKMNGADSVRISDMGARGTTLEIYFPHFTNGNKASLLFDQLLAEINGGTLPCGALKEYYSDNDDKAGSRSTTLRPVNESGPYADLKIRINKRPTFARINGVLENVFAVSVEIKGK